MPIWPFSQSQRRPSSQLPGDNPPDACCSFCGRPRQHVGPMVEGPNSAYICADCVRLAHQVAEGNAMQPAAADVHDPSVRWAGHMHIRCYFRLEQTAGDQWKAVADHPAGMIGQGTSPREAVRDLQAKVLAATAASFAGAAGAGSHFTNHADARFR